MPHLGSAAQVIPVAVRCRLGSPAAEFESLMHRLPDGNLVIELEKTGPRVPLSRDVDNGLQRILGCASLRALCDEAADLFKGLTGYDRVMVYRFDDDGHGEVFSEQRNPDLEAFLGNRYPASDIPQMARRLYMRNRIRVLVDVDYVPDPIEPRICPDTGEEIDMSLCSLRSMSPIHLQYLRNMGVKATLVISIVVGERLWGLIACHHYGTRLLQYEVRAVCEVLAEALAIRIAALESFTQVQSELSVRRLESRMGESIASEGDWRGALFDGSKVLSQLVAATGAALLFEDQILATGDVPATRHLREIAQWLDRLPRQSVTATNSLTLDVPGFEELRSVASGLVAAPVSNTPGEYLMWFRPEQVRTVVWGGDPAKPVLVGDDPSQLSPRRSFAQWHQLVEGTAAPWTQTEVATARMIGESVSDVVLQFRSVRLLIVQDQLAQFSREVQQSEVPCLLADPEGRIVLLNDAIARMFARDAPRLDHLDNLPRRLGDAPRAQSDLRNLLRQRSPWRGEVGVLDGAGQAMPYLVRGDAVFSAPGRVLGFVVLFTDLKEQKAADAARRKFQAGMIGRHRLTGVRMDDSAELAYRNLLAPAIENAKLAALEITDRIDLASMPAMLESVQASFSRTTQLLEYLVLHSTDRSRDDQ
jgi:GAF domain-containing protein